MRVAQHSSLDCRNPAHRSKPQACQEAVVRTWLGRNIRYAWIVECGFATGVIEARDRYVVESLLGSGGCLMPVKKNQGPPDFSGAERE
jgi:hypothetical protein